jgi:hypothetical protein
LTVVSTAVAILPMCGCTTVVGDLAATKVEVTNTEEWRLKTSRPRNMIRVDLTTRTDLSQLRVKVGGVLNASAFFCDHPTDYSLLGGLLYGAGQSLFEQLAVPQLRDWDPRGGSNDGALFTYPVLLNLALSANPQALPPEIGFDLVARPEDVCIRIHGRSLLKKARLNTVRIPADTIHRAIETWAKDHPDSAI